MSHNIPNLGVGIWEDGGLVKGEKLQFVNDAKS